MAKKRKWTRSTGQPPKARRRTEAQLTLPKTIDKNGPKTTDSDGSQALETSGEPTKAATIPTNDTGDMSSPLSDPPELDASPGSIDASGPEDGGPEDDHGGPKDDDGGSEDEGVEDDGAEDEGVEDDGTEDDDSGPEDDNDDPEDDNDDPEDDGAEDDGAHIVDLANNLQYIINHRIRKGKDGRKYYELFCRMLDGSFEWIPERVVQTANNAAVIIYWDSKPKGRPKRQVKPELLRVWEYDEPNGKYRVQMVGDPFFKLRPEELGTWLDRKFYFNITPTYMEMSELKRKWPRQYKTWVASNQTTGHTNPKGELQVIFGHEIWRNKFRLSLLYSHYAPLGFKDEKVVQCEHNAACLTYWRNSKGCREKESIEYNVPVRYVQILGHRYKDSKLFLTVQRVGGSVCQDDVEVQEASKLMKVWKTESQKYVKEKGLQTTK